MKLKETEKEYIPKNLNENEEIMHIENSVKEEVKIHEENNEKIKEKEYIPKNLNENEEQIKEKFKEREKYSLEEKRNVINKNI